MPLWLIVPVALALLVWLSPAFAHVRGTCWLHHDYEDVGDKEWIDTYARRVRTGRQRRCRRCGWTTLATREGWGRKL